MFFGSNTKVLTKWRQQIDLAGLRAANRLSHLFSRRGAHRSITAFMDMCRQEQSQLYLWVPVALGVGIGIYFGLEEEPTWTLLCVLSLLWLAGFAGHLSLRGQSKLPGLHVRLLALGLSIAGADMAKIRTSFVAAPKLDHNYAFADVEGRVTGFSANRAGTLRIHLKPYELEDLSPNELPEIIRVTYRMKGDLPKPGDVIRLRTGLMPPPEQLSPDAFDFARLAWFQQLGAVGYATSTWELADTWHAQSLPERLGTAITKLRAAISTRIRASLPGETGGLAVALLTGDRSHIEPAQTDALRRSSLAHLLAISGLHMGLVGWTVFAFVRFGLAAVPSLALRWNTKKVAAAVGLTTSFAYLLLSGASVSTQRAFVMIALMFVAIFINRPAISMRLVATAALIILVWHPESIFQAGFQMSFAACTALIAGYEMVNQARARRPQPAFRPGQQRSLGMGTLTMSTSYVGGILLSSAIAGFATAPFSAFHFHQFANYGILANLGAMPVMAFWVMPLGLLALFAMPFGLEQGPLNLMSIGIDHILSVAANISAIESGVTKVITYPFASLGLIAFGGLWIFLWKTPLRWAGVLGVLAGVLIASTDQPPDLVIARDGSNIAVRMPQGALSFVETRSNRFDVRTWSEMYEETGAQKEQSFNCDPAGCVMTMENGIRISLVKDPSVFPEECRWADILISKLTLPESCRQPQIRIGGKELARSGGHAIWFDDLAKVRAETTKPIERRRPWET